MTAVYTDIAHSAIVSERYTCRDRNIDEVACDGSVQWYIKFEIVPASAVAYGRPTGCTNMLVIRMIS